MMKFKCTPQFMGLVRGDTQSKQKHRANGKKIAGEVGKYKTDSDKRLTHSDTYDESKSYLNCYTGYDNGYQAWDHMENRASEYRTIGTTKNGKQYERPLRRDAVIGFAMIINPPEEVCSSWSDDEYDKFYSDTWDIMCEIEPRLFNDKNIVMTAEHFDEGSPMHGELDRHLHIICEARDENDKYCGNLIDARLLSTVNTEYPKKMRERGWDMEDLDTTDWKRMKTDDSYRTERKTKWKKNGKSVNKYLSDKAKEASKKANDILAESESILLAVKQKESELDMLYEETKQQAISDANKELSERQSKIEEDAEIVLRHKRELEADRDKVSQRLSELNEALVLKENTYEPEWTAFLQRMRTHDKDGNVVSFYDLLAPRFEQFKLKQIAQKQIIESTVSKGLSIQNDGIDSYERKEK